MAKHCPENERVKRDYLIYLKEALAVALQCGREFRNRRRAKAVAFTLAMTGSVMAQERIRISCDWGTVTAAVADNAAAQALMRMLPLTIQMRDHLRQEKTGTSPRRSRKLSGRPISRSELSGCGAPITSSSTTGRDVCPSQELSSSAA